MANRKKRRDAGTTAQNAAIDTTGAITKTGSAVVTAAIGVVQGISKALWRRLRPKR